MNRSTPALQNLPFDTRHNSYSPLFAAEKRRPSELAAETLAGLDRAIIFFDSMGDRLHPVEPLIWNRPRSYRRLKLGLSNNASRSTHIVDLVAVLQKSLNRQASERDPRWPNSEAQTFISSATGAINTPQVEASDALLQRYKQLNSEYYAGRLTADQETELQHIAHQLDELDTQDARLTKVTTDITSGYKALDEGLAKINSILDELLSQ